MGHRKIKIKLEKVKPRNPYATPARKRKAGPMKDRRKERGGAKKKDLFDGWDDDPLSGLNYPTRQCEAH
jgi:hypothetical protein